MTLNGLNVSQTKVTLDGLKKLAVASSLRELSFSCQGEASAKVCEVIHECRQVTHFEILDASGTLNTNVVIQCAQDVSAVVVVQNKRALQQ
jgi:hypothetical protein